MLFADIPDHSETKQSLISIVESGHIPHALMFNGKEGYAHLALALAFQQYLTCENRQSGESCGSCASCQQSSKLVHPDHHFIFPVSNTKKTSGKDAVSQSFMKEWREWLPANPYGTKEEWATHAGFENKQLNIAREENYAIIRNLSMKSFSGRFKTMTIWLPEHMHPSTANGILKILEEPPVGTIFILITNDIDNLLPTIVSRTQVISVTGFQDKEIGSFLSANYSLSQEKAMEIAHLSEGSMARAIDFLEDSDASIHDQLRNWMLHCLRNDFDALVKMSDDFHRQSRMSQIAFLKYTLSVFRETLVSGTSPELHHFTSDKVEWIAKFSQKATVGFIEYTLNDVNNSIYYLERNASPKITFMQLSIRIAEAFNLENQ